MQLIYAFFAPQEPIGAKTSLDLRSVLASIRRWVMQPVSVLPFGKSVKTGKKMEKLWGTFALDGKVALVGLF